MIVVRGVGYFLVGVIAATTVAAAEPASLDPRLDSCHGLPARNRIARAESIGEDAIQVVARSGERFLAFPLVETGCEVYALGHPASQLDGHFGAGTKAIALRPSRCGGGDCPIALAIRGKADLPILALRTSASCDVAAELHRLKLFADRDVIELVCRNSAGAGWSERHVLFDATEDTLVTLYSLDAGSYVAVTRSEQRAGECASYPVGSIRVEKVGDQPLVRVVDPATGTLQNGQGTVPARQLGYDAKRHELVPTGAADVPTAVNAHRGAHH